MIKISRIIYKLFITLLYKIFNFKYFEINPVKSYFHGRVTILNGKVHIGNGFRNKFDFNLSINGGELFIGNNVFVNNNVSINCRDRVVIGDNALIGEHVLIYDHDHKFCEKGLFREQGFKTSKVTIGSNVWIGSNVIILKGVTIGNNVVISAGSVVSKDIPKNTVLIQKRTNSFVLTNDMTNEK